MARIIRRLLSVFKRRFLYSMTPARIIAEEQNGSGQSPFNYLTSRPRSSLTSDSTTELTRFDVLRSRHFWKANLATDLPYRPSISGQ